MGDRECSVGDAFDGRICVQQSKQAQFGDIPSCAQDESGLRK